MSSSSSSSSSSSNSSSNSSSSSSSSKSSSSSSSRSSSSSSSSSSNSSSSSTSFLRLPRSSSPIRPSISRTREFVSWPVVNNIASGPPTGTATSRGQPNRE